MLLILIVNIIPLKNKDIIGNCEFYIKSMKSWLHDNDTEMYSTHEGKFDVAERFIRTLQNKIYNYLTSISKNVYSDKLDKIVNEHKNTYHKTLKIMPLDVKSSIYWLWCQK